MVKGTISCVAATMVELNSRLCERKLENLHFNRRLKMCHDFAALIFVRNFYPNASGNKPEFKYFCMLPALILVAILSGCATQASLYSGSNKVVHIPNVEEEAEAEIGRTIVQKINVVMYPAIQIDNDLSSVKKIGIPESVYTVRIKAGGLVAHSEDSAGIYYAPDSGTLNLKNLLYDTTFPCVDANQKSLLRCGLYIPNETNKLPLIVSAFQREEVSGLNFRKTTKEVWIENSFKKELIYGGLSQKTISISYREFFDGTARPAFTQEVKYDLSEGDIIGFRGARFKVIKATNTSLRYKLLKPLE